MTEIMTEVDFLVLPAKGQKIIFCILCIWNIAGAWWGNQEFYGLLCRNLIFSWQLKEHGKLTVGVLAGLVPSDLVATPLIQVQLLWLFGLVVQASSCGTGCSSKSSFYGALRIIRFRYDKLPGWILLQLTEEGLLLLPDGLIFSKDKQGAWRAFAKVLYPGAVDPQEPHTLCLYCKAKRLVPSAFGSDLSVLEEAAIGDVIVAVEPVHTKDFLGETTIPIIKDP